MKQLPRIAASLYCEPWCIRPEVHASICQQFRDHLLADDPVGPRGYNYQTDRFELLHPQIERIGDLALAKVHGIIGKHLSNMELQCGGFDLDFFEQQMANVRDDDRIETLVIDFRTPGGRVTGVESAALAIREVADSGKKVIGYTSDCCCSAGYWLACACDEFYAEGSAIVGSISTLCAGVDSSRAWEIEGLELKLFATGELKAIGLPGKKWTEAEEAFMRERGEGVDRDFKGFVKARRGLSDDLLNGAHWYAKHAPPGVIDGQFRSLHDVLVAAMS
jgi:ClpP class serine protease